MESITIGPFNISLEVLISSASVLAGYLVLEGTSIDHLMTNIFIAGLYILKFSSLIWDFQLVIHNPMSLTSSSARKKDVWYYHLVSEEI